jgi:hypothetical protein
MAELVNPYANPYLPSFVNQRPVINQQPASLPTPQMSYSGINYGQIHSVKGFEGADAYNLANGASEILAEEDPNLARIYVVAKDTNGQMFVQGFDLVPVERPKQVTMDDLSSTMNQILDRLNKLEGEKNAQSDHGASWENTRKPCNGEHRANGRDGAGGTESAGSIQPNSSK